MIIEQLWWLVDTPLPVSPANFLNLGHQVSISRTSVTSMVSISLSKKAMTKKVWNFRDGSVDL